MTTQVPVSSEVLDKRPAFMRVFCVIDPPAKHSAYFQESFGNINVFIFRQCPGIERHS